MRISHLNKNDFIGGAAKACYRLHNALNGNAVESKLFVAQKFTHDKLIFGPDGWFERILYRVSPYIDLIPGILNSNESLNTRSSAWCHTTMPQKVLQSKPDIVQLHWICAGLISIEDILNFADYPIVWTLHDMWPFCGAEHISSSTKQIINGFDKARNGNTLFDLDKWVYNRKKRVYKKMKKLYIVTPSLHLADLAKKSYLFKNRSIRVIPNGLDTKRFAPKDKTATQKKLNLDRNKKYVLFGAEWALSDQNKGFDLLMKSISQLSGGGVEGLVFGDNKPVNFKPPIPMHFFGRVDEEKLIDLYNAADVMVVPSRFESFGQTASESQSCGLPVVAFDTSGLKDIVVHKKTGYLAKPFDTSDLSHGINWVLKQNQMKISENCRINAVNRFDINKVAKEYISLYNEILNI